MLQCPRSKGNYSADFNNNCIPSLIPWDLQHIGLFLYSLIVLKNPRKALYWCWYFCWPQSLLSLAPWDLQHMGLFLNSLIFLKNQGKQALYWCCYFCWPQRFTFLGSLGFIAYRIVSVHFDSPKEPRKALYWCWYFCWSQLYFSWLLVCKHNRIVSVHLHSSKVPRRALYWCW